MKNLVMAVACLLAGLHAAAETNQLLTWEQCLARAENDSPELASARSAVRELEYGVDSASSGFFPQIDASSGYSRGQREDGGGWKQTESMSAGIDLRQNLFSGWATMQSANGNWRSC